MGGLFFGPTGKRAPPIFFTRSREGKKKTHRSTTLKILRFIRGAAVDLESRSTIPKIQWPTSRGWGRSLESTEESKKWEKSLKKQADPDATAAVADSFLLVLSPYDGNFSFSLCFSVFSVPLWWILLSFAASRANRLDMRLQDDPFSVALTASGYFCLTLCIAQC